MGREIMVVEVGGGGGGSDFDGGGGGREGGKIKREWEGGKGSDTMYRSARLKKIRK